MKLAALLALAVAVGWVARSTCDIHTLMIWPTSAGRQVYRRR